jgi:HD superfamily phosphohydrolase
MSLNNKHKYFTDPIHGFVTIPKGLVLKLVDHAYVQRLRRIRQLGLGYLVFPGSEHSRFSHAIGALGLMQRVINNLKEKNTTITRAEHEAVLIGILLHDIGHGPFSHTLEQTIISDFHHEMMTLALMRKLNEEFKGELDLAIEIFTGQYKKQFLHQLISSQLDMDRLDYLKRDSFYTGVLEGAIGIDRILKTLRVFQGNVVIENKGIYAIENYITARRLMYMQVYQHKTVLGADKLLRSILRRASDLIDQNVTLFMPSPALEYFLVNKPTAKKGLTNKIIQNYLMLDDNDILISIKYWQNEQDPILADLCNRFLSRKFFRTTFIKNASDSIKFSRLVEKTKVSLESKGLPSDENSVSYYLFTDSIVNEAYRFESEGIWVMEDEKTAVEFSRASETRSISALTQQVVKPYIVHLKDVQVL